MSEEEKFPCPSCGTLISKSDVYCKKCGAEILEVSIDKENQLPATELSLNIAPLLYPSKDEILIKMFKDKWAILGLSLEELLEFEKKKGDKLPDSIEKEASGKIKDEIGGFK